MPKPAITLRTVSAHEFAADAGQPLAEMLAHGPIEIESGSVLRTSRLVLRPLRASDREQWIALVQSSREDLDRYAPLHAPGESDLELFERQLALTEQGESTGMHWRRVAVLDSGALIGGFNVNSIERGLESSGDINWWVGIEHQGRGLATEAVGAAVDYAFLDMPAGLGLHRLTASIKPGHDRSARLAGRVGFDPINARGDTMRCAGGEWASHDLYSILPVCT